MRHWIIQQIEGMDGIDKVHLSWSAEDRLPETQPTEGLELPDRPLEYAADSEEHHMGASDSAARLTGSHFEVMPPRFGSPKGHETVTLISEIKNEENKTIGRIEVVMRFHTLMEDIEDSGWRQSDKAYLVDHEGRILTCTTGHHEKKRLDETPLEVATLRAMRGNRFGTVLSEGFPPREVSGFYRLREAPWSLVIIAPGKEILAPIIRFALLSLVMGAASIVLILFLIPMITGPSVSMIREVSGAAERVARGDYSDLPSARTRDEVGQLVKSFNAMVLQLEERMRLKEAMHVAMEVQQSLLPRGAPVARGLDIAGKSIYCEETGGDYYDFFQLPAMGKDAIGIAVGDVVGHGIGAALLMTTVRAFLHSKASESSSLSRMISHVNGLVCRDTEETCGFVTLFFAAVHPAERKIQWVRAGHDPSLIYTPSSDTFEELRGEGIALGVDGEYVYPDYTCSCREGEQIMVVGTDGIWETENPAGVPFGKPRLKDIIRSHGHLSADEILNGITEALADFRQTAAQTDDATLIVVKIL